MSSNSFSVAVTGANGFIAGELIKHLLVAGYTVVGTVRDQKNQVKCEFLWHLDGAKDRLTLVDADILDGPEPFTRAFRGCKYVFHTASPVAWSFEDPENEVVKPAVEGTANVLSAVLENKETVEKVILTSSVAAVVDSSLNGTEGFTDPERVYTEEDWNTTSSLESGPYRFSKVKAERYAWEWSRKHSFPLSVLNPFLVLGPALNTRLSNLTFSQDILFQFFSGRVTSISTGGLGLVDVRDVAKAHIQAALLDEATGQRFILTSGRSPTWAEILEICRELKPGYGTPNSVDESQDFMKSAFPSQLSNKKAQEILKINFTPIKQTLSDTLDNLISNPCTKLNQK